MHLSDSSALKPLAPSLHLAIERRPRMNFKYILGAAALSLLLSGTAYPQQQKEEEKPAQHQEKQAEPAKQPEPKQKQERSASKQQQHEKKNQQKEEKQSAKQQNERQRQTEQSGKQREDQQKQQRQVVKQQQEEQKQQERQQHQVAKQQQRNDQERTDQDTNQRSDNDHGRRIPDEKFRASFGREHHFHHVHVDNRRFTYSGYWFTFNEAWPVGWAYDDDFYIDYIDGEYYLIDLMHPEIQLLLVID